LPGNPNPHWRFSHAYKYFPLFPTFQLLLSLFSLHTYLALVSELKKSLHQFESPALHSAEAIGLYSDSFCVKSLIFVFYPLKEGLSSSRVVYTTAIGEEIFTGGYASLALQMVV